MKENKNLQISEENLIKKVTSESFVEFNCLYYCYSIARGLMNIKAIIFKNAQ